MNRMEEDRTQMNRNEQNRLTFNRVENNRSEWNRTEYSRRLRGSEIRKKNRTEDMQRQVKRNTREDNIKGAYALEKRPMVVVIQGVSPSFIPAILDLA
jgi:predicted amidophosphoribosyltransferase